MNKKTISPNLQKPVDRVPTGQLPSALAELNEAALSEPALYLRAGHVIPWHHVLPVPMMGRTSNVRILARLLSSLK